MSSDGVCKGVTNGLCLHNTCLHEEILAVGVNPGGPMVIIQKYAASLFGLVGRYLDADFIEIFDAMERKLSQSVV